MTNDLGDERPTGSEESEINLLDYLLVFLKRKKFICAVTIGATLLVAFVSLIVPKTYRAESRILPPVQNGSTSSQLLSQLSGATGFNVAAVSSMKTPNDLYIGLLKSRPVLDGIIDKLKMMEHYRTRSKDEARTRLLSELKPQDDKKSGIITVAVENRDASLAAQIANTAVDELKTLNKKLAVTEAGQRRLFYEEQLRDVRDSLLQSEESMKGFQEKTGAIKMDDQAKAVIQSVAQMRAAIASKEVQLKVMKTYATSNNPDAQRLEEEVRGLKEQLVQLESKSGQSKADPFMPTSRMPQLGTDYARKMRELKFNEALFEILLKQFEAAKLDEARDAAIIQIVEKAETPEKRIRPKRTQMVIIAFIVSFFVSAFGAFFLEYLDNSRKNPENRERLELMRQLARLRRRNRA
jgi:tyrosine-protein kinase Etk/Wzc